MHTYLDGPLKEKIKDKKIGPSLICVTHNVHISYSYIFMGPEFINVLGVHEM
jgi:hypothetical protein